MQNSSTTKLTIDLTQGKVEAEGTEEFVRFIYQDFKDSLSKTIKVQPAIPALEAERVSELRLVENQVKASGPAVRPKAKSESSPIGKPRKTSGSAFKPTFNASLNLVDLETYFLELRPKGSSECFVVFAAYLRERLGMSTCTLDDIYTCFFTLRSHVNIPTAFLQAMKDAKRRTHFIDYTGHESIEITIAGHNWLGQQGKKVKESTE